MTCSSGMPDWLEPMAATLTQERFTGPDWMFERKFDGIRLLAYKRGADVRLYSRNRLPQHLPAVAARSRRLPVDEVILDGEVTWDGRSALSRLRHPVAGRTRRHRAAARRAPRAAAIAAVRRAAAARRRSSTMPEPWERARREGWEGVIAKRRGSPYEHRRSKHWLKMKCEASQEFVVGGFTDPQGARVGLGALLVGYYEGDDFVVRRKGRHRLRHEAAAGSAHATRRDRAAEVAVHEGEGAAARARALGPPGDRRAGRVHRVDRARQAAPSAAARRPHRQVPRATWSRETRDHASRQGAVSGRRDHQGRSRRVLRGDRAGDAAAPARPAGDDGAISRPASARKASGRKTCRRDFPSGCERVEVPKKDGVVHHPIVTDVRSLLWVDQPEHHHAARLDVARAGPASSRPLRLRSRSVRRRSGRGPRGGARSARPAGGARRCRPGSRRLARKAFTSSCRSTARRRSTRSRGSRNAVGAVFVKRAPDRLTQEFSKADRRGRIYVDTGRNGYSATFAAAYTVRARRGAPVSAPCTWEEVERGEVDPQTFTVAQHGRSGRRRSATYGTTCDVAVDR